MRISQGLKYALMPMPDESINMPKNQNLQASLAPLPAPEEPESPPPPSRRQLKNQKLFLWVSIACVVLGMTIAAAVIVSGHAPQVTLPLN